MSRRVEIAVTGLVKAFKKRVVLNALSLTLATGGLQLLSGVNGAGKSTLMRILAGLERPDRGRFDLGRGEISWREARHELMARCVYLHQSPYMFEGTVRYNLGYALPHGLSGNERQMRIDRAVEWAGLEALELQDAKSLSGGERQRVALARAWLRNPRVLLLDEPTANMDSRAAGRTLTLLNTLKSEGHILLIASHEPEHFETIADTHFRLEDGRLTALDPGERVGQDTARITTLKRVR